MIYRMKYVDNILLLSGAACTCSSLCMIINVYKHLVMYLLSIVNLMTSEQYGQC